MTEATAHVLLVESDGSFRTAICEYLRKKGYRIDAAETPGEALELLQQNPFDVLVADIDPATQHDATRWNLIQEARSLYPSIVSIATARDNSAASAVRAMKSGASDYLPRPFEPADLGDSIHQALTRVREQGRAAAGTESGTAGAGNMIGKSPSMLKVFELVGRIAGGNSTVLITGETGTGKELVAQAIHSLSNRRNEKLVSINCGAIPENLLESELFGHVKGAFTGAHQTRIGRFEQANGGTIFLDEIGNMSVSLQVKLLRVLQEREFEKVGGLERIKVDVRIIAATSANLKEMAARNEFRSDLYYRLNVIPVQIPSLRERRNDVPLLASHFMTKICRSWGIPAKSISQEAMKMLMNHNWPGNVRELENAIERAVAITGERNMILPDDLPEEARHAGSNLFLSDIYIPDEGVNFNTEVSELERKLILGSMRKANGNKREAAELLQLKRTTLIEKLRRFSMTEEPASESA